MTTDYQLCQTCVMDTSDPGITFDAAGRCSHCLAYEARSHVEMRGGPSGVDALERVAEQIKRAGAGRPYDCVIGVSGGVDSTYVALLCRQLGLRPLALHLDNGWN